MHSLKKWGKGVVPPSSALTADEQSSTGPWANPSISTTQLDDGWKVPTRYRKIATSGRSYMYPYYCDDCEVSWCDDEPKGVACWNCGTVCDSLYTTE